MAINNFSNDWWDEGMRTLLNDVVSSSTLPQSMPIGNNGMITNVTASTIAASRPSPGMIAQWNMEEINHIMKGEMVKASLSMDNLHQEDMVSSMTNEGFKAYIKQQLCELLVREMMKGKLIEFTMVQDNMSLNYSYFARAYVMPDHTTKILREIKQRNT
jgi:hypothetical protein